MAAVPYILTGTVRKGPLEGYSDIQTTVTADGGETVDIYVSEGIELAASQTITVENTTTNESLTGTTDSSGVYTIDLQNFTSGATVGDAITIIVDTRTAIPLSEGVEITYRAAKAYKNVLVDKRGTVHDEDYPLPIVVRTQLNGYPDVVGNCSTAFDYGSRTDGQPETVTLTFDDGLRVRRTFTYITVGSIDVPSSWTRWEKL